MAAKVHAPAKQKIKHDKLMQEIESESDDESVDDVENQPKVLIIGSLSEEESYSSSGSFGWYEKYHRKPINKPSLTDSDQRFLFSNKGESNNMYQCQLSKGGVESLPKSRQYDAWSPQVSLRKVVDEKVDGSFNQFDELESRANQSRLLGHG